MKKFSEYFAQAHEEAMARAGAELARAGFSANPEGVWTGQVGEDGSASTIRVTLPATFPDELPKVELAHPRTVCTPHVGVNGKLCLASPSGTLLDAERPEQIIRDCLQRAASILRPMDAEQRRKEICAEFGAYWTSDETSLLSICRPQQISGTVAAAEIDHGGRKLLLGSDQKDVQGWLKGAGIDFNHVYEAYFVRLRHLFEPPHAEAALSLRSLLDLIGSLASIEDAKALRTWLSKNDLPSTILLGASLENDPISNVLFAARVESLSASARNRSQRGFRPGKEPPRLRIAAALSEPVSRLRVERADSDALVIRGGGLVNLLQRRVAVVGCGSVGSHVALTLATTGIGRLLLIDHESLVAANIYRHVLGASDIGNPKTKALANAIQRRLPSTQIDTLEKRVEVALDQDITKILETDLVIVAIGDDTIERRINAALGFTMPRIHVWLEPLGLGGHALSVGLKGQLGCFDCLFSRDSEGSLTNLASLAAPKQDFQRTFGGCAGTFTPFGSMDAQQAAMEAVSETVRLLSNSDVKPSLTTWVSSRRVFVESGFRLSRRGERLHDDNKLVMEDFQRPDCSVCGELRE